eukprot:TRINITY_DN11730_c0_g1_i1.p1 TRINITY_DN11730_c0_g1~~TRINITY_DN11730_c0_g1_i1.p1  ORF type:complete len:322 (-),score=42.75 TRINITY_DN11730_c0_g1_i1:3-968(-)
MNTITNPFHIEEIRELVLSKIPTSFLCNSLLFVNSVFSSSTFKILETRELPKEDTVLLFSILRNYRRFVLVADLLLSCYQPAELVNFKLFKKFGLGDFEIIHSDIVAASVGSLEYLKYFHACGYSWNYSAASSAADAGHLACLQFIHEYGGVWDSHTIYNAAVEGHHECLVYALENGCPSRDCVCTAVAEGGNLESLIYLHEREYPWDEGTCAAAAEKGHLECLKYAHENGCPWDIKSVNKAARNGHLECLMYLHENNCPWDKTAFHEAAWHGHMNCLLYLREENCPFDELEMYRLFKKLGYSDMSMCILNIGDESKLNIN